MKKKTKKIDSGKPITEFEKWLSRSTELLIGVYGIGDITVAINGKDSLTDKDRCGATTLLKISYSTTYKTANMWYYPITEEFYKQGKIEILRQALTHEIAHILTTKLADLALERHSTKREIEEAVENLTESIGGLCRKLLTSKDIKLN